VNALVWPIGTRMCLDGEEGAWGHIEVCGIFNAGEAGIEPVVRPVENIAGHDCSPRKVAPEAIVSLGYRVEQTGEPAGEWVADPGPPIGAIPLTPETNR